jgi:hypothetical protein
MMQMEPASLVMERKMLGALVVRTCQGGFPQQKEQPWPYSSGTVPRE